VIFVTVITKPLYSMTTLAGNSSAILNIRAMKSISIITAAIFIGMPVFGQVVGTAFPAISAENIHNRMISIPSQSKGKYTLIGMAYSKKAEEELNTWFKPIHSTFIQKPTGLFANFGYDVSLYFIPMFTGVNTAAAGAARKKAIKQMDQSLLPYVLFYKGRLEPYKETLDFEKRDTPYFFVLDKEGKIIYATSGPFSQKKLQEIETIIDDD
jgi:hypothetical protein